jgi:hypothetical protein
MEDDIETMHVSFSMTQGEHRVSVSCEAQSIHEMKEIFRGFLLGCTFAGGTVEEFLGE